MLAGLSLPAALTAMTEMFDAAPLAINTQFPSDVTPPETGPEPLETLAGDKGESAPVAGTKRNCET